MLGVLSAKSAVGIALLQAMQTLPESWYGGMEQVLKTMLHPTHNARLRALDVAIERINGRCFPNGSR